MKDEVQRISRLVAEGKLSPEDAADLIDAFYASENASTSEQGPRSTPPPPPGEAGKESSRDPFKGFLDNMERMTREGLESVNWQEVSRHARVSAKKGMDTLKTGLDDLSKGKVNIGWLTASETRDVEMSLSIGAGKSLKIENPIGDVKVVGGFDVGSIRAHAKFRGATLEESRAKAAEYILIVEEADHVVTIRQPDVTGLSVDLEIQVPGTAPIDIRVSSGDIQVINTGSSCRANSRSGDLALRGMNGLIEIGSESGDITIEDSVSPQVTIENKSGDLKLSQVRGNLNVRTASGDVTVTGGAGKVVAIESVSGDTQFDTLEPVIGTLNVRTVSGDVHVRVPDGTDCRVNLSTMRGSVTSAIALADEIRSDHRISGRLGEGSGTIDVSAITGDVNLEMHDSAAG
jgi:hypothetical protein